MKGLRGEGTPSNRPTHETHQRDSWGGGGDFYVYSRSSVVSDAKQIEPSIQCFDDIHDITVFCVLGVRDSENENAGRLTAELDSVLHTHRRRPDCNR